MPEESTSFLTEDFLRKLEKLRIISFKGTRGADRGEHISWRTGGSLEFLDYRKYQPGDDFRSVDWNVYGRLDKLFIKLFRAEENQTMHILIDTSRSMGFGNPSKDVWSKKIAAAISYLGLSNLDRIRLASFDHALGDAMLSVRSKQSYAKVLTFLLSLETAKETDFNHSLIEYASRAQRPGIAVILSDIMDPKGYRDGFEALLYERFQIAVIHLLDHEELSPSEKGNIILKEVETGKTKKMVIDSEILRLYQEQINGYVAMIKTYCLERGIDYYLCDTRTPFEDFFIDYMTRSVFFQ